MRNVRTDGWILDLRQTALFFHVREDMDLEAGHGNETRCVEWSHDRTMVLGCVSWTRNKVHSLHEIENNWKGPIFTKEKEELTDDQHNNINNAEGRTQSPATPVLLQDPTQHCNSCTELYKSNNLICSLFCSLIVEIY